MAPLPSAISHMLFAPTQSDLIQPAPVKPTTGESNITTFSHIHWNARLLALDLNQTKSNQCTAFAQRVMDCGGRAPAATPLSHAIDAWITQSRSINPNQAF